MIVHFTDEGGSSRFIKVLCKALKYEYASPHYPAESNKRNLCQVFTAVVIPKVCHWNIDENPNRIMKQTPEYRTCLSKNIRFQLFNNAMENSGPSLVYDGEKHDKSFEPGRTLWPLRDLYYMELGQDWKGKRDYQILLKTVYALASKEPPVVQRAIAWVIINQAEWGGKSIEEVCKTFKCWEKPIPVNSMTDWNAIDKWLPNVKREMNGWDPSRGSIYLVDPAERYSSFSSKKPCDINIGNFKFYKNP